MKGLSFINGKAVINGRATGRRQASAPSPAEIAAMAYDKAAAVAAHRLEINLGEELTPESMRKYLESARAAELAALRAEVIGGRKR